MAYCVHCGVKLGDSEKRCPLCQTPVFDPAQPQRAAPPPYPVRTPEQELKRSKRYLLTLSALMLLAPAALCLIIDFLVSGGITWSGYASGALIMLFIAVAVPLSVNKHQVYFAIGSTFVCLNGYLLLVEHLSQSGPWFFSIALPALTLAAVMIIVITRLYRDDRLNKLTFLAAFLAAIPLECLFIEWLCNLSWGRGPTFVWSPFVLAPCLFLSLALFFINGNRAVREEVRRRVHF